MTDWTIEGRKVIFKHIRVAVDGTVYGGDAPTMLSPTGGATYATLMNKDGTVAALGAYAHCSPKDHYNKKIGRLVAFGRLKQLVDRFQP